MALVALEEARTHNPGTGNAPLLPAPKDPFSMHEPLAGEGLVKEGREGLGT